MLISKDSSDNYSSIRRGHHVYVRNIETLIRVWRRNPRDIHQIEWNFGHSYVSAGVSRSKSITVYAAVQRELKEGWTMNDRETRKRQWKVVKRCRNSERRTVSRSIVFNVTFIRPDTQPTQPFIIHRASRFVALASGGIKFVDNAASPSTIRRLLFMISPPRRESFRSRFDRAHASLLTT